MKSNQGSNPLLLAERGLIFQHRTEWRAWLLENHASQTEAWLAIRKQHSFGPGIFLDEAVEEALCFGWIDSIMKGSQLDHYFLRFSARKPGSIWSIRNQARIERLIADGRMTEAGMVKVKQAQECGEWQAAIYRENTTSMPDDLVEALKAIPQAMEVFEQLSASKKKMLLFWIDRAKTSKTRQRRIQQTVEIVQQERKL